MTNRIFGLGVILVGSFTIVACGGGGGSPATVVGITLPACTTGTADYTGCWVSELCAIHTGGAPMRLLTEVSESVSIPDIIGDMNTYLLEYDNDQCNGDPTGITHLNTQDPGAYTQTYIQQLDTVCNGLTCEALDITIKQGVNELTGYTTLLVTNDTRLCMPTNDYNFDTTGSGSMQAQSTGSRDDVLDFAGACATRFTP